MVLPLLLLLLFLDLCKFNTLPNNGRLSLALIIFFPPSCRLPPNFCLPSDTLPPAPIDGSPFPYSNPPSAENPPRPRKSNLPPAYALFLVNPDPIFADTIGVLLTPSLVLARAFTPPLNFTFVLTPTFALPAEKEEPQFAPFLCTPNLPPTPRPKALALALRPIPRFRPDKPTDASGVLIFNDPGPFGLFLVVLFFVTAIIIL